MKRASLLALCCLAGFSGLAEVVNVYWTISTVRDFADRDAWGRAYDEAPFKLYEETTLIAHCNRSVSGGACGSPLCDAHAHFTQDTNVASLKG